MNAIIHQTKRFTVTLSDVRSANDMYTLDAVSHARVRRPFFMVTTIAVVSVSCLVGVWFDHLYDAERLGFAVLCATALFASSQIARLQLMSLQLRDHTYIYGRTGEIRALKIGIEKALMARSRDHSNSSRSPT